MKIGILTDSIACINEQRAIEEDIKIVYLNVIIDDNNYKEILDISTEDVFKAIDEGKKVTTSQPSPQEFLEAYEQMREKGYTDVISIHVAGGVSGTIQSAIIASKMVEGLNVHIFESQCASFEEEMYVDKAQAMIKEGKKPAEIIEKIEYLRDESTNYVCIDDLYTLVKTGRISRAQAMLGNLARMKPIISMKNGKFGVAAKVRTSKRVITKFIKDIKDVYEKKGNLLVHITHIGAEKMVNEICEKVKEISPNIRVKLCEQIGPVLGIHFGRGGIGISWTVDQ